MNLYTFFEDCRSVERRYWEYAKFVKQNPVRYPRTGDIFLQEYFKMYNPHLNIPLDKKKEVNEDSIWYFQSEETILMFFLGAHMLKLWGEKMEIMSCMGNGIPLSYEWYMMCLYHELGQQAKKRSLWEGITQITEEAPQFPIAKADCYARQTKEKSMEEQMASKPSKYCSRGCKGEIKFTNGRTILYTYVLNEDQKLDSKQRGNCMDHGQVAGDCLFWRLTQAYQEYQEKLHDYMEEHKICDQKINCEPFKIFAYMADCMKNHSLVCESKIRFSRVDFSGNPLLYILCVADRLNPIGKFPVENPARLMPYFTLDFQPQYKTIKWGINKKLAEMEEGKEYIKGLRELGRQVEVEIDIGILVG